MKTLAKLLGMIAILTVALGALGKTTPTAHFARLSETAARTSTDGTGYGPVAALGCRGRAGADPRLIAAAEALAYAEAVLIANGEAYHGGTVGAIRAAIAALPEFDPRDGVSADERASLNRLLQFGRQLAYARAAKDLSHWAVGDRSALRVASSGQGVSFEMLKTLEGSC